MEANYEHKPMQIGKLRHQQSHLDPVSHEEIGRFEVSVQDRRVSRVQMHHAGSCLQGHVQPAETYKPVGHQLC